MCSFPDFALPMPLPKVKSKQKHCTIRSAMIAKKAKKIGLKIFQSHNYCLNFFITCIYERNKVTNFNLVYLKDWQLSLHGLI